MSIRNQNKDHLKEHGGVELVEAVIAPQSDDPLRFWSNHPTESTLVDLYVFSKGESDNPRPTGSGMWSGPFLGRPELIAELAPAIQARLALMTNSTCSHYLAALRTFWRMFDALEAMVASDGRAVKRLTTVRDLTHVHEATAHRAGIDGKLFGIFVALADATRRLMGLHPLMWTPPSGGEPNRQLIPDDGAKALRIHIKQDWESVRKVWARHAAIVTGREPDTLSLSEKQNAFIVNQYAMQNEELRRHWRHLDHIQKVTGKSLPTTDQLYDGQERHAFNGNPP